MAADDISVPDLVTVQWLQENLDKVKCIDGSWALRKKKVEDYQLKRIKGYHVVSLVF
jgi:3-mercaptopyruvate sulfurtransferase SseA